jgi:threonine dehydratase
MQLPDVDAIVVPVGGTGLIAGVSRAMKTLRPEARMLGVEPDNVTLFHAALAAGKPVFEFKVRDDILRCGRN